MEGGGFPSLKLKPFSPELERLKASAVLRTRWSVDNPSMFTMLTPISKEPFCLLMVQAKCTMHDYLVFLQTSLLKSPGSQLGEKQ